MYHTITIGSLRQKTDAWNAELALKKESPILPMMGSPPPTTSSSSDTRGQYDMDIFKRKIQFIEYQKTIAKNKKEIKPVSRPAVVYETTEELTKTVDPTPFLKPWFRLDMYLKKIKVKEYIQEHLQQGTLTGSAEEYLTTLYERIQQKQLNTQKEVEYDSAEGRIRRIYCLHPKESTHRTRKTKAEAMDGPQDLKISGEILT